MRKFKFLYIAIAFVLFAVGCNLKQNEPIVVQIDNESKFLTIADSIITDVTILNPDGDEWTDYTLRRLDKKTLVDEIFKSVYKEELIPYEFFNDKQLTIEDIKAIEDDPEFSREKIAKVQFEEAWYYDSKKHKMVKKVHSIMLAYELYNSEGEIKGYKPAFKVYLNTEN